MRARRPEVETLLVERRSPGSAALAEAPVRQAPERVVLDVLDGPRRSTASPRGSGGEPFGGGD
eukprot:6015951-Lingulodinium_polyedra.AAC.1